MNTASIFMLTAGCTLALVMLTQAADANELYVKPGVAPGGTGTSIDDPVPTIQEAIDGFEGTRGFLFLHPGTYEEDVDVHKATFWFRPVERTGGVTIQGSFTIRRPGVIMRGLEFRSEGTAITLTEGASGTQILQARITAVGEGHAGIEVAGEDVSGVRLSDNVVDLRGGEGEGRTGIRIRVGAGVSGTRLDHNQIAGCETGIEFLADEGYSDETNSVTGNRILDNGIGLLLGVPGVTAARNEFRGNTAAGARVEAGPAVLDANTFTRDAVGVVCAGGEVELTSNVMADPQAQAVRVESGTATLVHNTIHAEADTGAALVEVAAGATAALRSNILSGPGQLVSNEGELTAFRNLFSHEAAVDDEGAIIGDPGFVAPRRGDLRLRPDSPAAHEAEAVEVDHDAAGIGRPWGQSASIGAYEVEGDREGRVIYVAAEAEGGDGSEAAPYGSISEALELVFPGDTVVMRPGEYTQGRVTITRSGAPGAPITVRSETPHAAKLVDTKFFLDRCSHVRIEGLDFTGTEFRQFINAGPYVRHCRFINNVFTRTEGHGRAILIGGPASTHNVVEGNRIALNSGTQCRGSGCCEGIQIICQRHNQHQVIRGNAISGCYYGVQTGAGSYPTAPPGYNLIEDNVFHDNWVDGIHTKSTDDLIRNNLFIRNRSDAITTRSGARNVIIGNWMIENGNGMRLHSPSHFIVNNVIVNNRGVGIRAFASRFPHYEAPPELWISHNTFVGNGRAPIILGAHSTAHILRNIIVGTGPGQQAIDRESMGHGVARQADSNLYFNVRPPLLREYEGGLYDRIADPLFLDPENGDFRVADDSPAREMPQVNDALSVVLSSAPGGIPLPDHIGSNLGPAPQER